MNVVHRGNSQYISKYSKAFWYSNHSESRNTFQEKNYMVSEPEHKLVLAVILFHLICQFGLATYGQTLRKLLLLCCSICECVLGQWQMVELILQYSFLSSETSFISCLPTLHTVHNCFNYEYVSNTNEQPKNIHWRAKRKHFPLFVTISKSFTLGQYHS